MKEAYEKVKGADFVKGDVVVHGGSLSELKIESFDKRYSDITYLNDESLPWFNERNYFRQLPPERNPDVLERAMMMMEIAWSNGLKYERTGLYYIDKAIRELESEAGR